MSRHVVALDRSLARNGETVALRRGAGITAPRLEVRVHLRGYQPHELVGSITQQDQALIMSPSEIDAAGSAWPGEGAARWPQKGDFVQAQAGTFAIQSGGPVVVGGEVVRLEYVVRGGR